MKILVVGGGGREHAILWKLKQSPRVTQLFCAPGNGGIGQIAQCVPVSAEDVESMVEFAKTEQMDFVIVSPDGPLALGMVDAMQAAGVRAFGPVQAAARLESSKVFSKGIMRKYGIPTAKHKVFDQIGEARKYLEDCPLPVVIKADGLALGKGVIIARERLEALSAADLMMGERKFGFSGDRIVVEEYIEGREVTVLAFTDGRTLIPMVSCQDHKKAWDGDRGPNTGGMGAFSPSPQYTTDIEKMCMETIFLPTLAALTAEGIQYRGILYFGLMLTKEGPKVLEYNARFGDPEAQAVLPLLDVDLLDILEAVSESRLEEIHVRWKTGACVCIILASGGYPEAYEKGYRICGLKKASSRPGILLFHSGTLEKNREFITNGGRVLGVTSLGQDLSEALRKAYEAAGDISFTGMHYRKDIGTR